MAKKTFNISALITGDSKGAVSAARQAQNSMREFDQATTDAASSLANVFGVSLQGIQSQLGAFKGGLIAVGRSLGVVGTSAEGASKGLKVFKIALASTGIGALVVAIGSLVSYFTKTQRGADAVKVAVSAVGSVFNNLRDFASRLGEKIFWAFNHPKEAINNLWEAIKTNIVNRFKGLVGQFEAIGRVIRGVFNFDWDEVKEGAKEFGDQWAQTITGMTNEQRKQFGESFKAIGKEIKDDAKSAIDLQRRENQLNQAKLAFQREEADMEARISELRRQAADREWKTAKERESAAREAMALTKELGDKRVALAKEEYQISFERDQLAENMNEDTEKTNNLYRAMIDIEKGCNNQQREMFELIQRNANEVKKEAEAFNKLLATLRNIKVEGLDVAVDEGVLDTDIPLEIDHSDIDEEIKAWKADIEAHPWKVPLDIGGNIETALEDIAVSLGETFGNILSGQGGFADFGENVLSIFGDLCVKLGKMAIGVGIAVKGIKLSLQDFQWYGAVAAGVALVALGTAVKGAMKNLASGASSSGSVSMATASPIGGSGLSYFNPYQQNNEIEIKGTLVAKGNDLVAVFDKTRRRNNYIK